MAPPTTKIAAAAAMITFLAAGVQGAVGADAVSARLMISPGGSDGAGCTTFAPCKSFARAFRAAKPGDTVLVAAGVYGQQTIPSGGARAPGAAVVFRPATGSVRVDGSLDVHGSGVEFRDLAAELWYAHPGASDLTFRNVDVDRFYVTSASDIRVLGGDVGPSVDKVAQIKSATDSTTPPRNILLDGLRVHDFTRSNEDQHMECLHVMAVDGLTIRNSSFRRCSIFDISFNEHGDSNAMRGILLENNVFDRTLDGGHYAVHFSSGDPCEAVIRFNTFLQGMSAECPETGAGVRVESNILPSMKSALCGRNGYSFNWNVYESGTRCGESDRVGRVAFVDRDGFDLRLARGSVAVARGNPDQPPAHDMNGRKRPLRWRPDAGAHQHESAAIVVGRSIGAAAIGATRATVEGQYGQGRVTGRRGEYRTVQYGVPGGRLWIKYRSDRVVGLGTASSYYSTSSGVGPGVDLGGQSRTAALLSRLPWDKCRRAHRATVRGAVVYYAPARGVKGGSLASVAMYARGADDCRP